MQDLEWLASAGLRHQRVVAEISRDLAVLPARFGTAFLSDDSLARHVKGRKAALRAALKRVAEADEWGVKVFAVAKPRASAMVAAVSGSDYLKKKAQMLNPPANKKLDEQVREFADVLAKLAVESTAGGKASAGQPGLLWHGSLLVRRKDQKKLESALKKYANKWEGVRRIEWSGPWPPYSFVEDHVSRG
jgi:Gas vesicle synthesis protein GvpL/GvpF